MQMRIFLKSLSRAILNFTCIIPFFKTDPSAETGRAASLALPFTVWRYYSLLGAEPFSFQEFFGNAAVKEIPGEDLIQPSFPCLL